MSVSLDLPFPLAMTSTAQVASVRNLDVFSMVPVGCAFSASSDDKLLMYTIVVVVTGAITLTLLLLWKYREKIKQPVHMREKDEDLKYFSFLFEAYKPEYWYVRERSEHMELTCMTGFLVVLTRSSYEQIAICLLVSVAMLKSLSNRRPYTKVAGAPDNNNMAEAMLAQTVGTLVLCVLLKTGKVGEYGMLGEGELDLLRVACQFLFVDVLMWKIAKGEKAVVAPELPK